MTNTKRGNRLPIVFAAIMATAAVAAVGCGTLLGGDDDDPVVTPAPGANVDGGDASLSSSSSGGGDGGDGDTSPADAPFESDIFEDAAVDAGGQLFQTRAATFEDEQLIHPTSGVDTQSSFVLTKPGLFLTGNAAQTDGNDNAALTFETPSLNAIDVAFAFRADALPMFKVIIARVGQAGSAPAASLLVLIDSSGVVSVAASGVVVSTPGKVAVALPQKMYIRAKPAENITLFALTTGAKPALNQFQQIAWSSVSPITEVSVGRASETPAATSKGTFTFDDFAIAPVGTLVK